MPVLFLFLSFSDVCGRSRADINSEPSYNQTGSSLEDEAMLISIRGICRGGHVELLEPPPEGAQGEVIVTFLASDAVLLADHGIDEQQAADLRHRLAAFAEDWDRPEMDVYDALARRQAHGPAHRFGDHDR